VLAIILGVAAIFPLTGLSLLVALALDFLVRHGLLRATRAA